MRPEPPSGWQDTELKNKKGVNYQGDKDIVYWLSTGKSQWVTDSNYYTLPPETSEYSP